MDASEFLPDADALAAIKRDIQLYQSGRRRAWLGVLWRLPVYFGLLGLTVWGLALAFNRLADPNEQWHSTPHVFMYVFAIPLAYFAYSRAMKPADDLRQSFRDRLLPVAFGFVDDVTYSKGRRPGSFGRIPKGALGAHDRQTFDDAVTGRYAGFAFELYEVVLTRRVDDRDTTVFQGVIVAFETIRPFPGILIATRQSTQVWSFFRGLFADQLEEVQSGIPEIDERYDFRTDNPQAAQPLASGRLSLALQWLAEAWPDEPARIAVHQKDGFLMLPTGRNFFELPSVSTPIDYDRHIAPMIGDLAQLLATAALVRKVTEGEAAHPHS